MSVLIKGMKMPKNCWFCPVKAWEDVQYVCPFSGDSVKSGDANRHEGCPLIPIPDHGDLIDRDALNDAMYHEAFETDSDMQRWDSGCWIRYKMFEKHRDFAPVVIPAERSEYNYVDMFRLCNKAAVDIAERRETMKED